MSHKGKVGNWVDIQVGAEATIMMRTAVLRWVLSFINFRDGDLSANQCVGSTEGNVVALVC